MDTVNPILGDLGRSLVEATAAHAAGDRAAVEAVLERASRFAGRLMDTVGGGSSMGTRVGEDTMSLYTQIETIELDGPRDVIFEALGRAIALTITVGQVANGPNPFARVPGTDTFEDDAVVPAVGPRSVVRA